MGEETDEGLVFVEEPSQIKYTDFHICLNQVYGFLLKFYQFLQIFGLKVRTCEHKSEKILVFGHFDPFYFSST